MNIHFEKATLAHKNIIFEWLDKQHVREFWDNSPEHREDIELFLRGRKETSNYFDGIFTYWIGLIESDPYCLLMTSEILPSPDLPKEWESYLSKAGKTFGIDFMIGNEAYFGRGLASPTLKAFTQFIKKDVDHSVDTFMIDLAETNSRAKHVYVQAGFEIVTEFVREDGVFKDIKHFLMIKRLSLKPRLVRAKSADYTTLLNMGEE